MKRITLVLLGIIICLVLGACENVFSETENERSVESKTEIKINIEAEAQTEPTKGIETKDEQEFVTADNTEQCLECLVWVPVRGGEKYHRKASCSNMKNPMRVLLEAAMASGFEPCGNCYR